MKWHRLNSARRIVELPLDGLGVLVVFTDVAHQLFVQVFHRGEDAAADHVALDAAEPVLHLVEPGLTRFEYQIGVVVSVLGVVCIVPPIRRSVSSERQCTQPNSNIREKLFVSDNAERSANRYASLNILDCTAVLIRECFLT